MPSGILTAAPDLSEAIPLFVWLPFALFSVSNFRPDTGGGDLLLKFASSMQSCCGEGGALQADVAVYGEQLPVFWPGSQQFWRPLLRCGAPFLSAASSPGSQMLGALSPGAVRLFPPRPQRAPPVGSQEVFRQDPGPVCRVGGGGFSGAEFAPCPSPCLLPPAGMGRLFSGVSQSLCFVNCRRCVPAG